MLLSFFLVRLDATIFFLLTNTVRRKPYSLSCPGTLVEGDRTLRNNYIRLYESNYVRCWTELIAINKRFFTIYFKGLRTHCDLMTIVDKLFFLFPRLEYAACILEREGKSTSVPSPSLPSSSFSDSFSVP